MQCKCIKLVNGENIIVSTEETEEAYLDKQYIEVNDPVLIGSFRFPRMGKIIETHVFTPWLTVSAERKVKIPTKNIMAVTGVKEMIAKQYVLYVSNEEQELDFEESGDEEDLSEEIENFISAMTEGDETDEGETKEDDTRTYH